MPISDDSCSISLDFSVSRYMSWFEGTDQHLPDIQFVDSMQRRRLSMLAKVSLGVMHACAGGLDTYSVVFASQHGELVRTTGLLEQLVAGEQVSPMGFSLAVLNAIPGVYSIALGKPLPCSAVSAGERTFELGLLEAVMQAKSSLGPVLYVYADEPVPAVYGPLFCGGGLHAVAMMVHGQHVPNGVEVSSTGGHASSGLSEVSQFVMFDQAWRTKQAGQWVGQRGQSWSWGFR